MFLMKCQGKSFLNFLLLEIVQGFRRVKYFVTTVCTKVVMKSLMIRGSHMFKNWVVLNMNEPLGLKQTKMLSNKHSVDE
jgi:hypothetical protein